MPQLYLRSLRRVQRALARVAMRAIPFQSFDPFRLPAKPGVHVSPVRGPNDEVLLLPIRDDGRFACLAPIAVNSPEDFPEAVDRAYAILEASERERRPLRDDDRPRSPQGDTRETRRDVPVVDSSRRDPPARLLARLS